MVTGRVRGETTGLKVPFNCPDISEKVKALTKYLTL